MEDSLTPDAAASHGNGAPILADDAKLSADEAANLLKPPLDVSPLRGTQPGARRMVSWLVLGLGIKRWALLALCGAAMIAVGAALWLAFSAVTFSTNLMDWLQLRTGRFFDSEKVGLVLLVLGILAVVVGLRGTLRAVERAFGERGSFLDAALKRRKLQGGLHVVALGGGTGLSTMLRGLKAYTSSITAVVTMADDGGSSGMLREQGMLPPGDLRNCLAALAEAEPTMTNLFQHRFAGLGTLKGHTVGNLVMAAMYEMTGDFERAVQETSKVLAISGKVLPSTLDEVSLGAYLEDGSEILGQSNVTKATSIREAFLVPATPSALPGVRQAIEDADVIIIGPGSLYTSIIPNLLVPGIADAVKAAKCPKIYVCNVMTQPGETSGYTASEHAAAIIRHIGKGVLTHVLVNSGRVKAATLEKYKAVGAEYVEPDEAAIQMLGVRPIHGNFINDANLVRHDPARLAATIFRLMDKL